MHVGTVPQVEPHVKDLTGSARAHGTAGNVPQLKPGEKLAYPANKVIYPGILRFNSRQLRAPALLYRKAGRPKMNIREKDVLRDVADRTWCLKLAYQGSSTCKKADVSSHWRKAYQPDVPGVNNLALGRIMGYPIYIQRRTVTSITKGE